MIPIVDISRVFSIPILAGRHHHILYYPISLFVMNPWFRVIANITNVAHTS